MRRVALIMLLLVATGVAARGATVVGPSFACTFAMVAGLTSLGRSACRTVAERGDAHGYFVYGLRSLQGQNTVAERSGEAALWLRRAADLGHVRAQTFLGMLYWIGRGVPRDRVQAYMWFSVAAAQDRAYSGGLDKLERRMNAVSIARAKGMAAKKRQEIDARKKAN